MTRNDTLEVERESHLAHAIRPDAFVLDAEERVIEAGAIGAGENLERDTLHAANIHPAERVKDDGFWQQ